MAQQRRLPNMADFRHPEETPQVKGTTFDKIISALNEGFTPGSSEYYSHLGISAKDKGLLPSKYLGPFDFFRMIVSPDARKLSQEQQTADKIGHGLVNFMAQEKMKQQMLQSSAPSLEDVASGFGGQLPQSIVPTSSQMLAPSAQATTLSRGLAHLAPSPQELAMLQRRSGEFSPLLDPNAKLNLPQLGTLEALRSGHVVEPTSPFVPPTLQGKREELRQAGLQPNIKEIGGVPYTVTPQGTLSPTPGFQAKPEAPKPVSDENRVSLADYGKPYLALSQPEQAAVNKKVDEEMKARAKANAAQMTVGIKQEGAESQAVGKAFGETYNDIQKAGIHSTTKISKLDRIGNLLAGVETGKLTPAMTEVAALGQSLGISIDQNLPAKQAAEALANEIALELRNPSGGAGMPGALSDRDREFLVSMTPGLGKTPGGNKLIIDTAKKLAQRDQQVARMARDYRKKQGHLDEGFYDVLQVYSDKHPLFPAKKQPAATDILSKADAILKGK